MSQHSRRLYFVLTWLVIATLTTTPLAQADQATRQAAARPTAPLLLPPAGRNGLGMGQKENGNPADAPVHMVDGVNVTNGNLHISDLHFQFNGVGPTFGLQVAYNSQAQPTLTPMGRKWTHSLNVYLEPISGGLRLHKGDGETIDYLDSCRQDVDRNTLPINVMDVQLDAERWLTQYGDSFFDVFFDVHLPADTRVDIVDVQTVAAAFNLPCTDVDPAYRLWTGFQADGVFSEIINAPAGPQMQMRDGVIYQFRSLTDPAAPGYLASVQDHSGNGYSLTYDGVTGRLIQAQNTSGASLQFTYYANGTLRRASDHTGRQVIYTYDGGSGDLTVVNRFGAGWRIYTYGGPNLLQTDQNALGDVTQYHYDGMSRLDTMQRPDTAAPQLYNYGVGQTDVTDPLGRTTFVQFSPSSGRVTQVTNSATGMLILYDFDTRGSLRHLGGGDGNHYEYDSRGNLVRIQSAHPDPGATSRLETRFSHDLCNNQTSVQDAQGAMTTSAFDSTTCQLISSTDPLGQTTQFVNNVRGQPVQITDPLGRVTQNTYDAQGNLVHATDAGGNVTMLVYDSLNRRTSETKPGGATTTFQYDAFDRQTRIMSPLGGITQMTYDALGNLILVNDPDGRITEYAYDGRGNKIMVKDAGANVTQYMYDDGNRMVRMTDPNGQATQVTYDAQDRPQQVSGPLGQTTGLTYDDATRTRTISNANGQITTFQLDRIGRVTQVTNADGQSNVYGYDLAGNLIEVTDPLSRTETFAYDAAGRKVSETDALGRTTTYSYDAVGNVTTLTNARGHATSFAYDYANHMTQVSDPLGGVTQMQYDAQGHRMAVIDTVGRTTQFVYDADDRLTQATRVTGGVPETTHIQYSAAGRQTGMIAPLGNSIQFTLDAMGRVLQKTEGPYTTQFQYNSRGLRTRMTDANGGIWTYNYDDLGRLLTSIDPLGRTTTYQYDLLGNLLSRNAPDGTWTSYTYDAQNRITRSDYSDGSHDEQTYDAVGNATSARRYDSGGLLTTETTFVYNARNQIIQTTQTISPTLNAMIEYDYDAVGNPTRKTYHLPGLATPAQIDMTWDAKNRLTQIERSDNGGSVMTTETRVYDLEGRVTQAVHTKNGAPAGYTYYGYDGAGRLGMVRHCRDVACTLQLLRLIYTYDANGNRKQETVEQGSQTTQVQFSYDPFTQSRLIQETRQQTTPPAPPAYNTQYTYDAAGNRVRQEDVVGGCTPGATCARTDTTYDGAHQIMLTQEFEGGAPTQMIQHIYDGRGNLAMRQSTFGPPVQEIFDYNVSGVQTAYQNPLGAESRTYAYDALGNKTLMCDGGNCTGYLYDGPNVAAEYTNATAAPILSASYLFGQEIDEQVARIAPGSADAHFFLRDALGSTRQIIDQVGAVVKRYEYRAFGELFSESGTITAPPNDLLFTGRPLDRVSERYDFRTRTYDPSQGRFLQPDPIYEGLVLAACPNCWQNPLELCAAMPLYTYVGNNPATYTDPTGEQWWFWYPWWWGAGLYYYRPYGWWGWWYGPWGWFGLRWWWWRWWWPANPWWGGWWWWQWRWWWAGWWWGWWGNFAWPWWWWGNWWWWPWWFGWGWWWWPWWWGGWWWPWWWFKWRGWWHWYWDWPFKWGWWCGWWWFWWWPWWWGGWWWPWWWYHWGGWGFPWWLGWGWWWWPWWWGGFWWPWWFGWGWWPWWGGRFWWPWWWGWRPWWWGTWWWGPWYWWGGWYWWPWWWGWNWWPSWWWCWWSLRPWWWGFYWIWWGWWRPWWWWYWWGAWWWWPSRWWWWFPLMAPLYRDVGDAPDSTNHYGASMVAYTGPPAVPAAFPTVYDPGLGPPYGPMHRYPRSDAWLGAWVSQENDADLIPDEDGPDWPNLDPPTPPGLSNRDDYDEGVTPGAISLPHCGSTAVTYTVTVAGGWRTRYINIWFDWNRDGAWDDTLNCSGNPTPEWVVQNLAVTLGPGTYTLTTPSFRAWKPDPRAQWMRITLSDAPFGAGSVGDGPVGGFRYGETEDYVVP